MPKERKENVAERHHAWTVTESQSAHRHIATAVEGSSVGNCGKQPQSDWWEKAFQKSVSCIGCMERQGGQSEHFLLSPAGLNRASAGSCSYNMLLYCGVDSP
jgi:hypothetical protein